MKNRLGNEDNIKMHSKEKACEDSVQIKVARSMIKWRAFVSTVKNLQSSLE
jgi:hypothetical protein